MRRLLPFLFALFAAQASAQVVLCTAPGVCTKGAFGSDSCASRTCTDTTPDISSVVATPGATSCDIAWTTDIAASSQVQYGLTTDYTYEDLPDNPGTFLPLASTYDGTQVTSHSVTISPLAATTLYHYRVVSTTPNTGDSIQYSADGTCTTASGSSSLLTNLVAHWNMNGAANGNETDDVASIVLTDANTNIGSASGALSTGRAFTIASTNNQFTSGNAALGLAGGDFTLAMWAKETGFSGLGILAMRMTGNPCGTNAGGYFLMWDGATHLYWSVSDLAVHENATGKTWPNDSAFHMILARYSAAARAVSISVDGGVPTLAWGSFDPENGGNFLMGSCGSGQALPTDGVVDEVAAWTKYVDLNEAKCLYGSGTAPAHPYTGVCVPPGAFTWNITTNTNLAADGASGLKGFGDGSAWGPNWAYGSTNIVGDGSVTYTMGTGNAGDWFFGISDQIASGNYNPAEKFGFYLSGANVSIWENGVYTGHLIGAHSPGDTYKIVITGSVVTYYYNDVLEYTSALTAGGAYAPWFTIYTGGDSSQPQRLSSTVVVP